MAAALRSWLRSVDPGGGLDRYLHSIGRHFGSPAEVAEAYVVESREGPVFDAQFFEDVGVGDPRHQSLFQRWFEAERRAPSRSRGRRPEAAEASEQPPPQQAHTAAPRGGPAVGGGGRNASRGRAQRRPGEAPAQRQLPRSASEGGGPELDQEEEDGWGRESSRGSDGEGWAAHQQWGGSQSWWDHGGWGSWRGGGRGDWPRRAGASWWEPGTVEPGWGGGPREGGAARAAGAAPPPREDREDVRAPRITGSAGAGASPEPRAPAAARRGGRRREEAGKQPRGVLDDWLSSLESSGALCCYRSPLEDFFDTVDQVFLAYTTPIGSGSKQKFDANFFVEAGITVKAHQHIFEQWFQSRLKKTTASKAEGGGAGPQARAGARAAKPRLEEERLGGGGRQGQGAALREQEVPPSASPQTSQPARPTAPPAAEQELEEPSQGCPKEEDPRPPKPTPTPEGSPQRARGRGGGGAAATASARRPQEPEAPPRPEEPAAEAPAPATPPAAARAKSASAAGQRAAPAEREASGHAAEAPRARSEERGAGKEAKEQRQASELAGRLRSIKEAALALPDPDPRPHAAVVLLGHAGAGKTALMGALLRVAGTWDRRAFEKFLKEQRDSSSSSSSSPSTRVERLNAEGRRFTLLDPPGQKRCVAQAWAAMSQADIAVLVVAAPAGEMEAGLAKGGQIREHAALAKSAGIESLVVAVNKMDGGDGEAKWSNLRFEEVRSEMWAALRGVGYHDDQVTFVPVSATTSDNLGGEDDEECEACSGWYSGGTLLEILETTPLPARATRDPLRVSVLGREKKGNAVTVACRVEQGELEAGAALGLLPAGSECGVQSLEVNGKEVRRALAGELVQARLLGAQPAVGQALCSAEEPLRAAGKFKAQIRLVDLCDDQLVVTPGFRCMLHIQQATEECEVSKIIEAVDPRSKKKEASPKIVRAPMVALCVLTLSAGHEVPVEPGAGRFARFSLRTDGGTIAIGKVVELPKAK